MKEIAIDEARFRKAEVGFTRRKTARGEVYRFELPDRSNIVEAEVAGSSLVLAPERSADHRALLAVLETVAPDKPLARRGR